LFFWHYQSRFHCNRKKWHVLDKFCCDWLIITATKFVNIISFLLKNGYVGYIVLDEPVLIVTPDRKCGFSER